MPTVASSAAAGDASSRAAPRVAHRPTTPRANAAQPTSASYGHERPSGAGCDERDVTLATAPTPWAARNAGDHHTAGPMGNELPVRPVTVCGMIESNGNESSLKSRSPWVTTDGRYP